MCWATILIELMNGGSSAEDIKIAKATLLEGKAVVVNGVAKGMEDAD